MSRLSTKMRRNPALDDMAALLGREGPVGSEVETRAYYRSVREALSSSNRSKALSPKSKVARSLTVHGTKVQQPEAADYVLPDFGPPGLRLTLDLELWTK